jgi:hypothetical protein
VIAATVTRTIAELLEAVFSMLSAPFSVQSVPGLYRKAVWTSRESLQSSARV